MQKILSLFQRNYDGDRLVRNEIVCGAEWVIAGEGVATRKLDGTCCLIRDGKLYKRYEIKPGGKAPPNFDPANELDENTGKQQGWVPVGDSPEDKWHNEAMFHLVQFLKVTPGLDSDGTYELVGPKVQGNPEGYYHHALIAHDSPSLELEPQPPRDFDGIREYLLTAGIEGIVWHHPDGRMVKVKARDFGIKRRAPLSS